MECEQATLLGGPYDGERRTLLKGCKTAAIAERHPEKPDSLRLVVYERVEVWDRHKTLSGVFYAHESMTDSDVQARLCEIVPDLKAHTP